MDLSKSDFEIAGCLRRLTKNRFLLRSKNEKWFQTILDYREKLQTLFNSFLIQLDINESLGVAYLRPRSSDIEEALGYQMGHRQNLGPLSSLLIFQLRNLRLQHFLNPSSDEVPFITVGELREFAQVFSRSDIDREFERQFRKSLEELKELSLLLPTASQPDLFEITAVCEILLPADQIQEIKIKMDHYFSSRTPEPGEV
ncbi:MAG: DUF4194 domain-containing protein [Bdellovibrionales bacterium]